MHTQLRFTFWTLLLALMIAPQVSWSQCSNVTHGGAIGYEETQCGPYDPAPIQNLLSASGGLGQLEYMWITTHTPADANSWVPIAGATGASYDPPLISQSTWYRRCARRAGCTEWIGEAEVRKLVTGAPTISVTVVNPTCAGAQNGTAHATVSGADPWAQVQWSTGGTGSSIGGLAAGTYTATITNANGCSATTSFSVVDPNPLQVTGTVIHPACHGAATGAILVGVFGGQSPYTYLWNGQPGSNSASGLTAGTYEIRVLDAAGCEATVQYVLAPTSDLQLGIVQVEGPCGSGLDTATAVVRGGQAPFSYQWSTGATTSFIAGELTGSYTVTVTDGQGCTAAASVAYGTEGPPTAVIDCCQDTVVCAGGTAEVQVELTGGGPWQLSYLAEGLPVTTTVTSSPYTIQLTPTGDFATVELTGVSNACGPGQVCGDAKIPVNDCSLGACLDGCFSTSLDSITYANGCATVSMTVTCAGCPNDLSNMTIELGCGILQSYSNSLGYQMFPTNGADPNSGLDGIKIDNISGFCGNLGNVMQVSYTVCLDTGLCSDLPACGPIVAYKSGNCVRYEQVMPPAPQRLSSRITVEECWPNPFRESSRMRMDIPVRGRGTVTIYDFAGRRVVRTFDLGLIDAGRHEVSWDGRSDQGEDLEEGIYLLRIQVGEARGHAKMVKMR